MLTPIQKETFKEFLSQIFPKEQAEYETLMFDLGYASVRKIIMALRMHVHVW